MLYWSAGGIYSTRKRHDTTETTNRQEKETKKKKRRDEGRSQGYMGLEFLERVFYLY